MRVKRSVVICVIVVSSVFLASMSMALARAEGERGLAPRAACNVPSDRPLIALALADASCDPITINGGRFHENLVVTRDVTIEGAVNATTTVDGDGNGPVFELTSGVSVTLKRLTVTDGSDGGIIADMGTALTLVDSVVVENVSSGNGGGISSIGALTLTNSTVRDNVASGNGGGLSFGTTAAGTMTLIDSTVSGNEAVDGGGIYNGQMGTTFVMSSTVAQNVADGRGGGVFNVDGVVTIRGSTLSENEAALGGGYFQMAHSAAGASRVENSTLSANMAITQGGGIFVENGTLLLTNATVFGNGATTGGGIFRNNGELTATNTIVAGSVTGGDCGGQVDSDDYNLAGDTTCTGFTKAHDMTDRVPLLGALADNGGPTATHALLRGSPALEAGSCMLAVDQRGVARPRGAACDMGAFEHLFPYARYLPVVFGGS